jgi:hypothetical protein
VTFSPQLIFTLIAAGAVALAAYSLIAWLVTRRPSVGRSLQAYAQSPSGKPVPEARVGSQEHKVRLAFAAYGLDVSGKEQLALYLAYAALGMALALSAVFLGLPLLLSLGGLAAGYFAVNGLVNSQWNKTRMAMEREIPTFLMNLSSIIQLTLNVIQALEDASLSLNPKSPLRPWIERLVHAIQSRGQKGLDEMQAEASDISPTLLLVVVEIARLWETGGQGYAQSFQMVSENLSGILEGRARALAKSDGAWGTIRVIVLALGGAILMAFSNPGSGAMFRTGLVQVAIVAGLAWAAFGWSYIGDLIREAVE